MIWKIVKQVSKVGIRTEAAPEIGDVTQLEIDRIQLDVLAILRQALTIRMVDAGSCNGCELEINALGNPYYNIEGLGIKFVAIPRHADICWSRDRCRATWQPPCSVPMRPRRSHGLSWPLVTVVAMVAFLAKATPVGAQCRA